MELHNRCDGRCMKEKCKNVLRKSAPRVIAFWAPKGLGICVQERRAKGFHQQLWTLFCYPSDAQGTYTIDTVLPTMVPLEKSNSGNMDTLKSTLTKTQLCSCAVGQNILPDEITVWHSKATRVMTWGYDCVKRLTKSKWKIHHVS